MDPRVTAASAGAHSACSSARPPPYVRLCRPLTRASPPPPTSHFRLRLLGWQKCNIISAARAFGIGVAVESVRPAAEYVLAPEAARKSDTRARAAAPHEPEEHKTVLKIDLGRFGRADCARDALGARRRSCALT